MSKEAVGVLSKYQTQIDPDGIEVGVSRQALDETLDYIAELEAERDNYKTKAELCDRAYNYVKNLSMNPVNAELEERIAELEAAGREAVKVLIKAGNQIGAGTKFLADSTVFDAADRLEKVLEGKQ